MKLYFFPSFLKWSKGGVGFSENPPKPIIRSFVLLWIEVTISWAMVTSLVLVSFIDADRSMRK